MIRLDSKQIHSDGLWENVGLAIKVALDFGINPKVIKKTVPSIQFEGRVQFIKGKLTKNLKKMRDFYWTDVILTKVPKTLRNI